MKRLKLYSVVIMLATLCLSTTQASDDYQQWLKGEQQAFSGYLEQMDKEFTDHLKKQWQAFQTHSGITRDETPKPKTLPIAPDITPPQTTRPQPIASVTTPEIIEPPPPVVVTDKNALSIDFFGTKVSLSIPSGVEKLSFSQPANKDKIAAFWEELAKLDSQKLQQSLKQASQQLQLNDWGTVQLSYQLAKKLYRDNERRILLSWFLLSKSGYNVKLGHDRQTVFLLVPTKQTIYETAYLTIEGERHYLYHFSDTPLSQNLYTYQGNYPKANKNLDLQLSQTPNLTAVMESRNLQFEYSEKTYSIKLPVNKGVVDFLSHYPQSDLDIYFSAAATPTTAKQMLEALKTPLQERELTDAINLLLRFVQTSFDYQTDQQQFGEENYLFLDETLYYSASDCEDRSVLFAWLVNNLLGLEVIVLNYPGHVATAILLEQPIKGDSVKFQNKHYMVADPTYINANLGMAMPQFKDTTPKIIPISIQ